MLQSVFCDRVAHRTRAHSHAFGNFFPLSAGDLHGLPDRSLGATARARQHQTRYELSEFPRYR